MEVGPILTLSLDKNKSVGDARVGCLALTLNTTEAEAKCESWSGGELRAPFAADG